MVAIRIVLHGKAAANPAVRKAVSSVRNHGHTVQVGVTWEAGDAARLTEEAVVDARRGLVDRIVAGGGDGTINEVFAAAYLAGIPENCSLGVLPLGTANDFAHATEIPVDDLTTALELVAEGPSHAMDVGLLDGRPFFNMLTGGFGSRITVETDPELKKYLGGLAYVLTGVTRFSELAASRGRFQAPGFSWEGPFVALAVGNGRQAGGGIPLCPDALLDDGLLDLMILPDIDPAERFDAFTSLLRQGADSIRARLVTARVPWIAYEAEDVLDVNLDGEPLRLRQFRVDCQESALRIQLRPGALLSKRAL